MRRRSGTGVKPVKAGHRKSTAPKRPNAPKAARPHNPPAARGETEVARLTRELDDALERETATSDVLQVISSFAGELDPVFRAILANATRICEADFGVLQRHDGGTIRIAAMHNVPKAFAELRQLRPTLHPTPESAIGRAVVTKKLVHIPDYSADAAYKNRNADAVNLVELAGARSLVIVPLLKDDELIGTISIYRQEVRPFTDNQIALVQNFASQAVIAIENARLLNELRQRTDDLAEALDRQTAASSVLQVISTSSGEVKPVFQSIVENAARLCEAQVVDIILAENNTLSIGGSFGELGRNPGEVMPLDRSTVMGRSICDKQPVQVEDLQNASDEFASGREFARKFGHRTILGVPLIHEDRAWGTILVRRTEVRPFTYKQIELVQNFAAQAVIAIENARLLNELREALRQQTATADVLRVISSSPGDLGPVFDAAIENATRLCGAEVGTLALYNGSVFRGAAVYGHSEQYANVLTNLKGTPPGTALAQLKERRQIVQIADVAAEAAYDYIRRANPDFGKVRAALYVPIVREGALIGAFMIYRHEVRPFTDKQVALVENFAAQAAIAIENARLLNELRESYELVREQATKVEAQSQELLKLNQGLEQRVSDQVGEIERMGRLRRFLPPQVADLIVALGTEKQLESHRREITALFCDLRGFTGFSESSDPEDVMALLRDYHSAIGEIIVKYSGTLERYAGDGVMVVFNDPVPVENPALQAVLMALEMRDDIGALTERWRRLGHDIGFGIGIAHGFATLGTIGFEGRFDYAAIGTVSNVASRLCDEAKPGQILISPRVLMKVEDDVKVEPVGEFTLKGIRRPLAAYNVLSPRTVS